MAVKAYRQARTGGIPAIDALKAGLVGYQAPVPADVMDMQMRIAIREATDLAFVPQHLRHLAEVGPGE